MEGNIAYLVMEFLEGEDLASLIARSGPLPIATSVDIMLPVLGAIAVAHEEGVIHRDLKPENVFMADTRDGEARPTVLDFGISKISSSGGGNTLALTGTGASMGTPYYIAPEQIRSAAGVDARSDQYALGAILYECVTGRRAHREKRSTRSSDASARDRSRRRAPTGPTFRRQSRTRSCGPCSWIPGGGSLLCRHSGVRSFPSPRPPAEGAMGARDGP